VNVKEYISSGIIESYVLGMATESERREFESLCAQHPEIAEARNSFELALEARLLADAKQAPSQIKNQVEERIAALSTGASQAEVEQEETPVRSMGIWKWMAAASVILLAGAVYWAVSSNNKYKNLQAENQALQTQVKESTAQLETLKQEASLLQKPGVKMAALKGTAHAPEALATIFWDTTSVSKDVYLLINNLPQPASDKQYQLWALLNGRPIDLGVFDMNIRQQHLLVKMQNVQSAQAFAITLEPKGGSTGPTMDSMYVMGSL
jgi:anti-sigma-K factor RskA